MTRAVHRAGFRPLAFASRHLLLRPAALKIAASIVLTLLALGLYSPPRQLSAARVDSLRGPAGAAGGLNFR